ncbi:2-amino-4-hydroxy-6-hydroxymethyldihydropteridine diphosphokinase [Pelagibius sp. 7325]|uniref:2-amino-4-hydroxy-6- hydroxymethyldihydropteridine diphosphokinase n=1 Tax=Pelagibius sp. 7325 TaxID=3131994 RepID=UPI0030EEE589
MILVGLGSNLATGQFKSSESLLENAISSLENKGITVVRRSAWYRSAPVPVSDQPWFVNGVISVSTERSPEALLQNLHAVENEYGRIRARRNESRTLDLDLLAYKDHVLEEPSGLVVPHPRIAERAFVLLPLAELAPQWRHPVTGRTASEMLAELPPGQVVERIG